MRLIKILFFFSILLNWQCSIFKLPEVGKGAEILAIIGTALNSTVPTTGTGTGSGTGTGETNGTIPSSPSISNIRDKGIINTGFLIGTAGTDATTVEVSIDSGAYYTATGVSNWKFQLPTGASTWRDNSQHTISVRAKNSSGNNSSVVTITVRKGTNKDINGDGYADLVVGSLGWGGYIGRVYIFLSSGLNGILQNTAASANNIINGPAPNDKFGSAVTLGDINGDGFSDLVAGAAAYVGNQGRAYIFYSMGNSGISITSTSSANWIITGEGTSNNFSLSLATGDVNGDGYADLIAGANGYNANQGRGYIFHSTGSSGISITTAGSATTLLTGEAGTGAFGTAIDVGDVNGDGYTDVIVGALGYSSNTGRVYIFHSSSSGITTMNATSANTTLIGEATGNAFGLPVVTGDINGDGFPDLIVAGGSWNTNQGRVYIFQSLGSSGINSASASTANAIITGTGANNYLGRSFCVGDTNTDGYSDLIIQGNAGAFSNAYYVPSLGASGITSVNASTANPIILNMGTYSNNNGKYCGVEDFNGDGYPDIVLGSMYEATSTGHARIYHSTSSGVVATDASQAYRDIVGEATSNSFGGAIPH